MKSVWTFLITSGPMIRVSLPDNPPLDYPGQGMMLWKIIATEDTTKTYAKALTDLGLKVVYHTEEMTEEMLAEKRKLQGCPSRDDSQ